MHLQLDTYSNWGRVLTTSRLAVPPRQACVYDTKTTSCSWSLVFMFRVSSVLIELSLQLEWLKCISPQTKSAWLSVTGSLSRHAVRDLLCLATSSLFAFIFCCSLLDAWIMFVLWDTSLCNASSLKLAQIAILPRYPRYHCYNKAKLYFICWSFRDLILKDNCNFAV